MAQPIPLKLPARDPKKELLEKLEQAPIEHAAALLDSYELLEQLHQHGVFSIARGALNATDKLVSATASGANSTEAIRAMRNAIILGKMLGSIDPELLQGISTAVGETLGDARAIPSHPPGIFSLLFGFTGPDHRRGLSLVLRVFSKIGHALNTNRLPQNEVKSK